MSTNTFTPLFSIIIPIYNVENYLGQCLESILNQSYNNYEIILVDDGSKDLSSAICKSFLPKFKIAKYIFQKNNGVAAARNNGLKVANGEYIIFIDSDDYIINNEALMDISLIIKDSNPDIIFHKETKISPNGKIFSPTFKKVYSGKHSFKKEIKNLIDDYIFKAAPWDKVIKKSILLENNILFPEGLKAEDTEWSAKIIPHINNFTLYQKSFYMYRQFRNGSQSNTIAIDILMDLYTMINRNVLINVTNNDNNYNLACYYWAEYYCNLLIYYSYFKNSSAEVKNNIKKLSFLMDTNATINVRRLNKFYKVLGFYLTIFFLEKYMFFRKKQKANENYN